MSWIKIDDSLPDHPKVMGVPPVARWLHIEGICYASRVGSDGYVPVSWMTRNQRRLVHYLEEAKLWERAPDQQGWYIHDYLDWQESREERDARSNAARNAARIRWGDAAKQAKQERTSRRTPLTARARGAATDDTVTAKAAEARAALAKAKRKDHNPEAT